MTLIYESEHARIYCGDASDELANIAVGEVALLATDPPYGVDWQSNFRKDRHEKMAGDRADDAPAIAAILEAAGKKCGKSGHVYVFGLDEEVVKEAMPRLSATAELIWDKGRPNAGNLDLPYGPSFEKIIFGYHVSSKADVRLGRGSLSARKRRGSVLQVPRKNGAQTNRHPTEKPVELMSRLIESSTIPGDTVLDPFLGSGSTAVAAILLGRKAIGIELEAKYAETAVERVKAAELLRKQVLAA